VVVAVTATVPSVPFDILSPLPKVRSLPETVISSLNDAAPALDISNVNAVTVVPPSFPLKIISLSETFAVTTKSLELFVKVPINVPPSLNLTSAPSASRTTSAGESSVTAPDDVDIVTAEGNGMERSVSNYEYEVLHNDSKKKINLIENTWAEQILETARNMFS